MKYELNTILENSLYYNKKNANGALAKSKADYTSDVELLKQAFWINMIGFLGLLTQYPTETRLITYLKTVDKVRIGNINDESHDVAIVTQLASDANLVNATFTNEFTKLLYILKTRTGVILDDDKIRDLFKKITPQTAIYPSQPILKRIVIDYLSGKTKLSDDLQNLYNVAVVLKICGDFQLFYRTLRNKTPASDGTSSSATTTVASTTSSTITPTNPAVAPAPAPVTALSKREKHILSLRKTVAAKVINSGPMSLFLARLFYGSWKMTKSFQEFYDLLGITSSNNVEKSLIINRFINTSIGYGSNKRSYFNEVFNSYAGFDDKIMGLNPDNLTSSDFKIEMDVLIPGVSKVLYNISVSDSTFLAINDFIEDHKMLLSSNSSLLNSFVETCLYATINSDPNNLTVSRLKWITLIGSKVVGQSKMSVLLRNAVLSAAKVNNFAEIVDKEISQADPVSTNTHCSFEELLEMFMEFMIERRSIDDAVLVNILKHIPLSSKNPTFQKIGGLIISAMDKGKITRLNDNANTNAPQDTWYRPWFRMFANLFFSKAFTIPEQNVHSKVLADMFFIVDASLRPKENPVEMQIKSILASANPPNFSWVSKINGLGFKITDIKALGSSEVNALLKQALVKSFPIPGFIGSLDLDSFFFPQGKKHDSVTVIFEYLSDVLGDDIQGLVNFMTAPDIIYSKYGSSVAETTAVKLWKIISKKVDFNKILESVANDKNKEPHLVINIIGSFVQLAYEDDQVLNMFYKNIKLAEHFIISLALRTPPNLPWEYAALNANSFSRELGYSSYRSTETKKYQWAYFILKMLKHYYDGPGNSYKESDLLALVTNHSMSVSVGGDPVVSQYYENLIMSISDLSKIKLSEQMYIDLFTGSNYTKVPNFREKLLEIVKSKMPSIATDVFTAITSNSNVSLEVQSSELMNIKNSITSALVNHMKGLKDAYLLILIKELCVTVNPTKLFLLIKFCKKHDVNLTKECLDVLQERIVKTVSDFSDAEDSTYKNMPTPQEVIESSPDIYVAILEKVAKSTSAYSSNSWITQSRVEKTVNNSGITIFYSALKEMNIPLKDKKHYFKRALDAIKINHKGNNRLGSIVDKIVETEAIISAMNHLTKKALIPITAKVDEKNIQEILKFNNFHIDFKKDNIKQYKSEKDDPFDHLMTQTAKSVVTVPDLRVTKSDTTDLDVLSTELFELCNGQHGDVAPQILEVFDVDLMPDELKATIATKGYKKILRGFHGTGSIAASMILRFGFKIMTGSSGIGGVAVTGKMLGNGIYCSPVTDKAMQYCSDSGYSRGQGNIGYLFDMDVYLNDEYSDYRSAGTGGDSIRSPEYCIFDPRKYIHIKRAYKVKLISIDEARATKARVDGAKSVQVQAAESKTPLKFKRFLVEDEGRHNSGLFRATFVFYDGTVPYKESNVEFDKFISATKDTGMVELGYSQYGPEITILTELEPPCSLAMIPDTEELVSKDPDGLYSYWLAITANL